MSLLDACKEYLAPGQQGQLVVKFAGDVHLCKILIDNGEAVHISHGRTAPELILKSLPVKTVEWVNFIAGYPVRKRLDLPLHQTLLQLTKGQTTPTAAAQAQPLPDPAAAAVTKMEQPSGPTVSAAVVNAVIEGFIDQIGPLGTILSEKIASSYNYRLGEPMPQSIYGNFVEALGNDVPEENRRAFIQHFSLKTP